jgi:steroid delta-isomerase-like uncharacterized protein
MNNLETIKAYHNAIWDQKDISSVDHFFSNEATIHSPIEPMKGTEKMKAVIAQWYQAFPDLTIYWEDTICEGNKVVSRWRAEASHQGEFLGHAASNNKINYPGITIYELEDGKISNYWCVIDMQNILNQLK